MEGTISNELATQLRQICASVISDDTTGQYDEAVLGSKKDVYVREICKSNVWGGAIELAILAEYYDCEIAAIDVESCHQYVFGNTSNKSKRIYLIYSGVHYDSLVDHMNGVRQRTFHPNDREVEKQALKAARLEQAKGAFTNVNKFTLRCSICKAGFTGALEAQGHAQQTMHQQFEEYVK